MKPSIKRPPQFRLAGQDGPRVTLASDAGFEVDVFVLEPDIVRVLHRPPGGLRGPRTWAIAPGAEDVADEGRERLDASGFSHPAFTLEETDNRLVIATERLRLSVRLHGLACKWEMHDGEGWRVIVRDRPTQAYNSPGGAKASPTTWCVTQPSATSAWASGPASWTGRAAGSG